MKAFRHLEPFDDNGCESIPDSPYTHIPEMLNRSIFVLRRRSPEEVCSMACRIISALASAREEQEGFSDNVLDDVDTLGWLMDAIEGHTQGEVDDDDIDAGIYIKNGWKYFETLSVLCLLKIDAAIGHIFEGERGLIPAAQTLLDAYKALSIAERDGRKALTADEIAETLEYWEQAKKERISQQCQEAKKSRKTEAVKQRVLAQYEEIRKNDPEKSAREVALEFQENREDLDPDHTLWAEEVWRTFYGWILSHKKLLDQREVNNQKFQDFWNSLAKKSPL